MHFLSQVLYRSFNRKRNGFCTQYQHGSYKRPNDHLFGSIDFFYISLCGYKEKTCINNGKNHNRNTNQDDDIKERIQEGTDSLKL